MSQAAPVYPKNFYGTFNKGQTSFWAIYRQVGSNLLFLKLAGNSKSIFKYYGPTACKIIFSLGNVLVLFEIYKIMHKAKSKQAWLKPISKGYCLMVSEKE
jgi:hypothetical protein